MYEYFYITLLIGAILLCLTTFVSGVISKRYKGIWRKIQYSLMTISVAALISFVATLPWGR